MSKKKKLLKTAARSVEVINTVLQQQLPDSAQNHLPQSQKIQGRIMKGMRSLYTTRPDDQVASFATDMVRVIRQA